MTLSQFEDSFVPEPTTGCLLWNGLKDLHGYGRVYLARSTPSNQIAPMPKGRVFKAHRLRWMLTHGPIADEIKVLHKCDTPPCGNVDHLFLGTQADNMYDMAQKKRGAGPRGENHRNHKLSIEQVCCIRRRHSEGDSYHALGREFGVAWQSIQGIIQRKYWGWVRDSFEKAPPASTEEESKEGA